MTQDNPDQPKTADTDVPVSVIHTDESQQKGGCRRKAVLIAVVIVLAALVPGVHYFRFAVNHESTNDAFIDGHIIPISPRVAGHVAEVFITDNQKVEAGDLLATLDTRDFQAKLDAAEAALHAAEAVYRSRGIEVNIASITTSASLDEAVAAKTAAEAMVQNAFALAAGAQSQQDETKAQVAVAKAALEQARAELKAVEAKYQQAAHVTAYNTNLTNFQHHAAVLFARAGLDPVALKHAGEGLLNLLINRQATMMAYNDVSWILGLLFITTLPLALLLPSRSKIAREQQLLKE